MFNIMVTSGDDAWEEGAYVWHRSRILEYTSDALRDRLSVLSPEHLEELAALPTLFMYEQGVSGAPRVGAIKRIQQRGLDYRVIFEFDDSIPALSNEEISDMRWDLQLEDFEFSRTHWAVKEGDLFEVLRARGLLREDHFELALVDEVTPDDRPLAVEIAPTKVFLVHGRDDAAKHAVARFLETKAKLQVVILSERPNQGRSILTKFTQEADGATFAIVLITGDDVGNLRPELARQGEHPAPGRRARQNVIFELGFFIGKLGAERVCALVAPGVDRPSDYDGIVYVTLDDEDGWQKKLITELHAADLPVSPDWWRA